MVRNYFIHYGTLFQIFLKSSISMMIDLGRHLVTKSLISQEDNMEIDFPHKKYMMALYQKLNIDCYTKVYNFKSFYIFMT